MSLADSAELKRFLARHGISAEKSLGQHFLCSDFVVQAIVDRASDLAGILEIGPGPGILTSQLAAWDRRLIALELDSRMLGALAESAPYAEVLNQDALQSNFAEILDGLPRPRGIVGNLPYYITAPLLEKIAGAADHFEIAILMMQKEVADRISAPALNADRGSFSVYLQSVFTFETVVRVPPTAFEPPPKVQSTVLQLRPRPQGSRLPDQVMKLVRLGFVQPRKTLSNNLIAGLKRDRVEIVEAIQESGLRADVRPHMLTQPDWLRLAELLA